MPTSRPGKVLVVDDDRRLRDLLTLHLRDAGFDVCTAENGRQGVEHAIEYRPDVIVMDWAMPVMDGIEATARLKENPLTSGTPVILLTANHDTHDVVLGLETGAVEYVTKPFAMEELVARVRSVYRLTASGRELDGLAAHLSDEIHRTSRRLELLYDYADRLNKATTLDEVLDLIVSFARRATDARRVSLMLRDERGEALVCRRAVGIPPSEVERIRVAAFEGVAGTAWSTGTMVHAQNLGTGAACTPKRHADDAFLCAPLVLSARHEGRQVLGVLNVTDKPDGRPFTEEETACIQSIADSAAIAVHNQISRRRLEQWVNVLLMTVGRLAEYRDEETASHLERVQDYVRVLALRMAEWDNFRAVLTPHYIDNLHLAAPLHDIGKVGIPDVILTKDGPLTKREFRIMKTHTTIGRQTLELAQAQTGPAPLLQMSIDIAYCHHEKYDGTGYPQGLSGETIPLPARIIALADAYDAVTSRRRYKDPVPHGDAVDLLRADSRLHFDPDVVRAFEQRLDEFDRIRAEKSNETIFSPALVSAGQV